jgi:hypothetical protein
MKDRKEENEGIQKEKKDSTKCKVHAEMGKH